MKTYFLLSDINVGILIVTAGGVVTAVLTILFKSVIVPVLNKVFDKQLEIRKGQIESHEQMDGLKDQLVKTTKALGLLEGNKEGRKELIQEQKEEANGNKDSNNSSHT